MGQAMKTGDFFLADKDSLDLEKWEKLSVEMISWRSLS